MAQRAAALLAALDSARLGAGCSAQFQSEVAGFGGFWWLIASESNELCQVTSSHPESGHGSSSWMELQTQEARLTRSSLLPHDRFCKGVDHDHSL